MRTRRLIKFFEWREEDRPVVTLGPRTRINPEIHQAHLTYDPNLLPWTGGYPTADLFPDLWLKSKLTEPKAARRWTGFEAVITHAYNPDNPTQVVTSARFRLDNGSNEYYWNGSAWAVAAFDDWNTEAEIASNIHLWDIRVFGRKMRVVVNLRTTDRRFTPFLTCVKLLYEAAIEFQEDIIYRSLVPMLREKIRPIARTVFSAPSTGVVFNIETLKIETPYNIVDVDSVFNYTTDSELLDNLLVSYNSSTKNVTLSQPVTSGQLVYINFIYEPEVAVTTSQDYIEAEKVPALILTGIALGTQELQHDQSVANKAAGTAVVVPAPEQGDLQVTLIAMSDKALDNARISDEIKRFFSNNKFVTSTGMDERYRLWLVDEFQDTTTPGQKELHSGEATFRIMDVRFWTKDAYDDFIAMSKPKTGGNSNLVLGP